MFIVFASRLARERVRAASRLACALALRIYDILCVLSIISQGEQARLRARSASILPRGTGRRHACPQESLPPLSNTINHFDMLAESYRGLVRLCLTTCHDQLADYGKLRVQVKPTRSVFVTDNLKVNELKLVPLSPTVQLVCGSMPPPQPGVMFGRVFDHPKTGEPMTAYVVPKVTIPKGNAASGCAVREVDSFVIPYWIVRHTPDSAMANLVASSQTVHVACGLGAGSRNMSTYDYNVPILTNKTPLQAGDELLLYKASGVKRPIEEVQEADAGAAPKAKAKSKAKGKAQGKAKARGGRA